MTLKVFVPGCRGGNFSSFPLLSKMNAMSTVFRRAYSTKTLIPPNVAAATKLSGSAKDAQIAQLVSFYQVTL